MASLSSIEWTEATWNPVTGCSKVSTGCQHCYAERMARRLCAMGQPNYRAGFTPTTHAHMLGLPLAWPKPRKVFVNSMSDLLHESVPLDFIKRVFETMVRAHWHTFQVLTKRSERLRSEAPMLPWPSNIWVGVTVESADYAGRLDHLRAVPASVRFVSFEPLLGPVDRLDLAGIDWVIVGGESGPGARPLSPEWVTDVRDQCVVRSIPFFFKQWGGVRKHRNGRLLANRIWDGMPDVWEHYRVATAPVVP